ncbi:hypothetical protein OVA07_14125 [Novosphingobium sp. SL115]|uniref:hypothetical protein n=1 Tax=Novosphingobium sp. SL115 TaxID=2995150 RepID=UPI002276E059|nr:hypothetical protein [Novosphingobium sp. SL115]MCY1672141.1 hypothetical protein [Novosphingobium sp. SL115]
MPATTTHIPAVTFNGPSLPARHKRDEQAHRISFDKALRMVLPRLTRRQRWFLAAVAGMRAHDSFDVAMIELLEAPGWERNGLVHFADSGWKRRVGRTRQHSSSYRLTDLGRMFVMSAARLIPLTQEGARR